MIVLTLLIIVYFIFIQRNSITRFERIFYYAGIDLVPNLPGSVEVPFRDRNRRIPGFFSLARAVFEIRDPAIRFMVFVPVIMIPLFSIIYLGHAIEKFYTFDELETGGP